MASTSLSQEFLTVLIAGMAKNPTDRPTSAGELKIRLEHLKNETNQTMEPTKPHNSPKDFTERLPRLPIINDSTMGTVATSQTSNPNKRAIATAILLAAVFILAVTVIAVRSTEIDEEAIRADTVFDTDPTDPTTGEDNTQAAPPTITRGNADREEDNIPQASVTVPSATAISHSLLPQPDVIAPSGTFVEPNFKTIDVVLTHEVTSINYHGRLQGNETHDYVFEATQGQQLDVMFTGETNISNVRYTLIQPNGTELFTDQAEPYSHILPTGGTFKLSVEPSKGLEGEYNVQISLRQPGRI